RLSMKRILLDLGVVALLVMGDVVWRLLSQSNDGVRNFVTLHITVIWIVWVSIVAAIRATWSSYVSPWRLRMIADIIEWIVFLLGIHVLLCWLDTIWQPADDFSTVLAFTIITL